MFLGELKILNNYKSLVIHVVSFATSIAKINNYSLIYLNIFNQIALNI